jgi:type I restriction enzyme M protein
VDKGWLRAVVSMPSNIFATTGTNVSIIFIDKTNKTGSAVLVDASELGTRIKEGKNQKTLLSEDEEAQIINAVNIAEDIDGFCVVKTFEEIAAAKYSFNPGSYFDVSIEHIELTPAEFGGIMKDNKSRLARMFAESKAIEDEILAALGGLIYE